MYFDVFCVYGYQCDVYNTNVVCGFVCFVLWVVVFACAIVFPSCLCVNG